MNRDHLGHYESFGSQFTIAADSLRQHLQPTNILNGANLILFELCNEVQTFKERYNSIIAFLKKEEARQYRRYKQLKLTPLHNGQSSSCPSIELQSDPQSENGWS